MTNDITTTTSTTLTLEECDEAATQGILLLSEAVLNYAKHGLTSKAIGERVRGLGQNIGDSTVRRWISGFKADKLLPEREVTVRTEQRHRKAERETTNAQNEQMSQPQPEPEIIDAEFVATPHIEARLANLPSDEEIAARLATKTCGYIITGAETLKGLLDFIELGDPLSDEAHDALSLLHHRLNLCAEKLNRPFKSITDF